MQLEQMTVQIRETMIYTPKDIGLQSIYTRFLKMYDQILEEREFDRALKRKQEIDARWQREYQQQILLAKLGYVVVVLVLGVWMTALFSAL
jgi:maltodextrin utilization protein YvdJ